MSLTVLDRERTVAGTGYNRWLIPPAALAVHLCIGQAYATSVYKSSLVEHFDTSLTAIGIIFSIAIVMLGLSAAVVRHLGRHRWAATGDVRRRLLLVHRVPGGRAGHRHQTAVAGLPRVRLHRRHRAGARVHLSGLDADQVVPRPARAWPPAWRSWASAAAR